MKLMIKFFLCFSFVVTVAFSTDVSAATKVKISDTKLSVTVGSKKRIKVKGTKKKVTWKIMSGKSKVSIKRLGKSKVIITGKKAGSAKVQGRIGKKKYTCKVTVKNKRKTIKATVKGKTYKIKLYNNKSANQFYKKLPIAIKMNELNGNEKYYYFPTDFSMKESNSSKVKKGDLKLFGSDCIVWFYKTFRTSYQYTPLGNMENSKGLEKNLGSGNVKVQFKK